MHLCLCVQLCEDAVRSAVMSEAADEALELDCDHATPTIKEIVCGVAPTPPYVKYHDTYLRRYVATGTLPACCWVCHLHFLQVWCAAVPCGVFIVLHVTAHIDDIIHTVCTQGVERAHADADSDGCAVPCDHAGCARRST
jgi:hypothetical protein